MPAIDRSLLPQIGGGRRYSDPTTGLPLLWIWAGDGALTYLGRQLTTEDRTGIRRVGPHNAALRA